MDGFATFQIMGYLHEKPEVKHSKDDFNIVEFFVVFEEKKKDGTFQEVSHKVKAMGEVANSVKMNYTIGCLAIVNGKININRFRGKDGEMKEFSELLATKVTLATVSNSLSTISEKRDDGRLQPSHYEQVKQQSLKNPVNLKTSNSTFSDDDIPF